MWLFLAFMALLLKLPFFAVLFFIFWLFSSGKRR